ncbi:hypothetical protein WJX79_010451 [Trebouxia sp. C0005]
MRRNAKSNRAPLAPLHDNSLKGDSSHKLFNGTKMDAKSAARVTNKPTAKSSTSQVKLSDKAVANLAGSTYLTGHKTAGRPSPVKPRKTVQLGAGTPQDFSDVFDLDEVSGQTPGGAATFVGQALVRLASSEKVIRLMSPVDLDAPHGNANPHATFTPATLSLPKFTLAALDSPKAHTAALTRQPSGSVNGPEDAALASSPVSSQSQVVPIQAVVSQLLSSPKLAITGSDTAQDDKLPYQTLLQHLLGAGQTAANSPGVAPSCSGPAKDDLGPIIISAHNPACAASAPRIDSTPGLFCPRAPPLVHPNVQATPARHRLAQATYKTPSTQATVPEAGTASAVSFCFASAVADHPSPLATFLHQLSHATYESEGSAAESAPATHDDTEADFSSPQPQKGPTPFQDFMKYLTQATYHSPGTKADQPKTEICRGGQSNSGKNETVAMPLILAQVDKEMPAASPVRLSEEGMAAWLQLAQMSHAIKTPARNQLQDVWRQAREAQHLSQMAEEASNVREENAALQHQLADIETSLQQLTQSNEATLQDIQVQRQVAITEGEKAKRTAQQLLALAHQTSKVTEAYEAERQALRKDVTRAQTQLLEAQASSRAAEAAANTSHEEKAAMAETLSLARDRLLAAEEVMQAQAAATAAGHTQDGDLHLLKAQLKEAHEAVYEVHQDQQMQAHLTADLAHQEQENAALRDAIAAAQQQLHDAAAAAASRVLAEKALEGEQQARQALEQAHSLAVQEAQAKQTAQEQENALLAQQLQEATEQLLLAQTTEQPVALQIFVMDDTCSRVAATLTPAKTCSSSQSPAAAELESVIQHAAQQLNSGGNPLFGRSNMANPLFSPAASSPDPMLTPFYTPASMSSIRTGLQTPASKFAFGGKEDLAGNLSGSPAGLATPGSGVVTGDWRSVTDRLQALRAQLQSAQKKLKATSEEKQKRSAPAFSSTPLADVTPRHSQSATPLALSQQYDRAMSASPLLIPAALAGQENVEEHCLSANRWLRGLAEECVDNMYTPAKPQATNDIDVKPQGEGSQAVTDGAAADRDEDRVHVHKRELVSHPIIPTSPSTWDGSSVMSSPALSVHSPFPESAPAPMSSGCRLVVHCNRTL